MAIVELDMGGVLVPVVTNVLLLVRSELAELTEVFVIRHVARSIEPVFVGKSTRPKDILLTPAFFDHLGDRGDRITDGYKIINRKLDKNGGLKAREGGREEVKGGTFANTFLLGGLALRSASLLGRLLKCRQRRQILITASGLGGSQDANGDVGVREAPVGVRNVDRRHLPRRGDGSGLRAPTLTSCGLSWSKLWRQGAEREDWEEALEGPRPNEVWRGRVNGWGTEGRKLTDCGRFSGLRLHLFEL